MEFFGQSYCTSGECSEQFTDDRQRMLHIIIISSPKKVTPAKDWIRSTSFFSPTTLNSKHARMLNVNANWFSFERKVNLGNRLNRDGKSCLHIIDIIIRRLRRQTDRSNQGEWAISRGKQQLDDLPTQNEGFCWGACRLENWLQNLGPELWSF